MIEMKKRIEVLERIVCRLYEGHITHREFQNSKTPGSWIADRDRLRDAVDSHSDRDKFGKVSNRGSIDRLHHYHTLDLDELDSIYCNAFDETSKTICALIARVREMESDASYQCAAEWRDKAFRRLELLRELADKADWKKVIDNVGDMESIDLERRINAELENAVEARVFSKNPKGWPHPGNEQGGPMFDDDRCLGCGMTWEAFAMTGIGTCEEWKNGGQEKLDEAWKKREAEKHTEPPATPAREAPGEPG